MQAVANRNLADIPGPCQKVDFEEEEIKLSVPAEGVPVGFGGSVFPLTHPGVCCSLQGYCTPCLSVMVCEPFLDPKR